jgi:hypothetical protein
MRGACIVVSAPDAAQSTTGFSTVIPHHDARIAHHASDHDEILLVDREIRS